MQTNWLELWYDALRDDIGIVVDCSPDSNTVAQKLYAARKESGDLSLFELKIITSPTTPNQIWIVKKRISINASPEGEPPPPESDPQPL